MSVVQLVDEHMRLMLLCHLVTHCGADKPAGLQGIDPAHWARLQTLSVQEFVILAAVRECRIEVGIDGEGLGRALRLVPRVSEAAWLETYFLRHGASWQLMRALFRMRRKIVLRRRRELGAWQPAGRSVLPDEDARIRIRQLWDGSSEGDPRMRYYRLHQAYRNLTIRVLEEVLRARPVE